MMNEHKVIVVSFLEPKPVSFEFTKWPNHITIVPYFQTSDLERLSDNIKNACISINQIPYQVDSIDYFGIEENVKVSQVKISDALLKLHTSILNIALSYDKNMDTKFCYQTYKPHITHNNEPYPQESDKGSIKMIYLIKKLSPITKEKKIVAIFNLA